MEVGKIQHILGGLKIGWDKQFQGKLVGSPEGFQRAPHDRIALVQNQRRKAIRSASCQKMKFI